MTKLQRFISMARQRVDYTYIIYIAGNTDTAFFRCDLLPKAALSYSNNWNVTSAHTGRVRIPYTALHHSLALFGPTHYQWGHEERLSCACVPGELCDTPGAARAETRVRGRDHGLTRECIHMHPDNTLLKIVAYDMQLGYSVPSSFYCLLSDRWDPSFEEMMNICKEYRCSKLRLHMHLDWIRGQKKTQA